MSEQTRKYIKLLVIHDQPSEVEQITDWAEMNDHLFSVEIQFTNIAEKAYELIGSWNPSVIMLDAHLTDENSFEVLNRVKDNAIPIVMTSEHNSNEIGQSAIENGADMYFSFGDDPEFAEYFLMYMAELAVPSEISH